MNDPLPNTTCPACGGPNGCVPARTGSFDARCWCADVSIDKAALERLSDADRGRACLCAACAGVTARARSEPGGER